jgi:hypothetical protein
MSHLAGYPARADPLREFERRHRAIRASVALRATLDRGGRARAALGSVAGVRFNTGVCQRVVFTSGAHWDL